jgi:type IV pilus assembly protein PilY1
MSRYNYIFTVFSAFLACFIGIAAADDIDIYNPNPNTVSGKPNILLVLDNAAANNGQIDQLDGSRGDKLEMIRQVMNLLLNPQTGTVYPPECGGTPEEVAKKIEGTNMGLMIFNPKATAKGGYVRYAIRDMGADTTIGGVTKKNRLWLLDKINNPGGTPSTNCVTEAGLCAASYPAGTTCTNIPGTTTTKVTDECGQCSTYVGAGTCSDISLTGCSKKQGRRITVSTTTTDQREICTTTQAPGGIPAANNAPYGKTMWEAYQYYSGQTQYEGFASSEYDPVARNGNTNYYKSPIVGGSCAGNNVLFVGTGGPDSGEQTDTSALLAAPALCADTNLIPYPTGVNTTYQSNNLDEFAKRMSGTTYPATCTPNPSRPKIATHGIMVRDSGDTQPGIYSAMQNLTNASKGVGGGEFYEANNGQAFLKAVCNSINNMQAVNSAFAAVTLPVSANVSGANLNQVYMGVFRPDANSYPRWFGNLKQYMVGKDPASSDANPVYTLVDSSNPAKVVSNSATGFINSDVVSFWTTASTYWDPNAVSDKATSDSPDGPLVEKGGAAEKMRKAFDAGTSPRKLYTCFKADASCAPGVVIGADPKTQFVTGGANPLLTATALGVADAAERDLLVSWLRGLDNSSIVENTNPNKGTSTVRPSIHGDVLHSRPAVVNYNRYGTDNDVYVFYGSNDGVFRAVKGGQSSSDGYEAWGMVFEEFLPSLKMLRDNSPLITSSSPKPYYADGAVSIYRFDSDSNKKLETGTGDKVWLFINMRRGGRFMYALDVTNPENPIYKWSIGCPSASGTTGCTPAGFGKLGQTWSAPFVTSLMVKQTSGSAVKKPVLIFAGGYDRAVEDIPQEKITARDANSVTVGVSPSETTVSRTMGMEMYIVDADNGNLLLRIGKDSTADIQVADMDYAMPADVQVLQRLRGQSSEGLAKRAYVGDTGGNVWRLSIAEEVDFTSATTKAASFKVSKLAAVGTATNAGSPSGTVARKFLYQPDVVFADYESSGVLYDAVLLGSGDRESPLSLVGSDAFYMFKDYDIAQMPASFKATITESDLYPLPCAVVHDVNTTSTTCTNTVSADLEVKKGWKFTLGLPGERVVTPSITARNLTYFSTNTPPDYSNPNVCTSNLGQPTIYNINYTGLIDGSETAPSNLVQSALQAFGSTPPQGLLPAPVRVVVQIDGKAIDLILFGSNTVKPKGLTFDRRVKKYWHKKIEAVKP